MARPRIDIGKLTADETLEIVQELIPELREDQLWIVLTQVGEHIDREEIIAHFENKRETGD